ncbi:cupin domain-containing protein [Pelosinus propionicus]|uniref:Cupin domain-containing protein n=1 Tax=Pelosinus propionicus DSM 13327 TaxID=1123291 RepID=A0A1I4GZY0_9FIRM|nr:cupin domain-containing protein [Pelosinus propionicus]SFL34716.1 Cupin domain-containing protein [Pelosinus propionicus DSM 13327]
MEKINVNSLLDFSNEKSVRKALTHEGSKLDTGLLLYAPGQNTPEHTHKDMDEVFYVVEGEGILTINGKEFILKEKDIILSPRGEGHGFFNTSTGNLVVLQVKIF